MAAHYIGQNVLVSSLSWPQRFHVSILPVKGTRPDASFEVVTWLHAEKAISIAIGAYQQQHKAARIYDVSVEHVGAAKRAEDGTVDIDKGDLVDRFEW